MKAPEKIVVWPANIDNRKTRKYGRKVSKSAAIESPRLHELVSAASRLSLSPEKAEKAALPYMWWEKTGYIRIDKKDSRKKTLLAIVQEIKSLRKSYPKRK